MPNKLFTDEIMKAFEQQGYVGDKSPEQIKIVCKVFNPYGSGVWYLYEYDANDEIFWCYANLGNSDFAECGAVSRSELENYRSRFGMPLERDLFFPSNEKTLAEIIEKRGEL